MIHQLLAKVVAPPSIVVDDDKIRRERGLTG